MPLKRLLTLAACVYAASALGWAREPAALKLQWSALGPRIGHKKVAFMLPHGTRVEGRAITVEADGLRMKVTKSSNRKAQPKGKQLVPRRDLTMVRVTEYGWVARLLVTVGAMGLATGAIMAQQIDLYEGPAIIVVPVMCAAGVVGAGVGGYYVGKRIDKRVTEIAIAPD